MISYDLNLIFFVFCSFHKFCIVFAMWAVWAVLAVAAAVPMPQAARANNLRPKVQNLMKKLQDIKEPAPQPHEAFKHTPMTKPTYALLSPRHQKKRKKNKKQKKKKKKMVAP